jgi:pyruvyltransferase
MTESIGTVEIFHWNPRKPVFPGPLGRLLPVRRKVNNFGDMIGPVIVRGVLDSGAHLQASQLRVRRLLSVGSVLHFAGNDDVIWGSGVNGKISADQHRFERLDVRAVRGPRTRAFLLERGIETPEVYGDHALLLPQLWPHVHDWVANKRYAVTVVPNLNDRKSGSWRGGQVLDPTQPLEVCVKRIAQSEFVVGSSLHALILADALGVPARRITSSHENDFKYEDYYAGTGRESVVAAGSVKEALALGGVEPMRWSSEPLWKAFPNDLWGT